MANVQCYLPQAQPIMAQSTTACPTVSDPALPHRPRPAPQQPRATPQPSPHKYLEVQHGCVPYSE
ncbi:hypothetical protein DV515_00017990 [Chloebia gouldiae]|uniref:Uncharacterized protein n=1 Tax=Chloebia gouldiae TaxID=44316 RepID=A0A3L8Q9K8_CHLGU|nr:hypothetical protein DV515_00017990 [Chloebia gouldiae]